MRHPGSTKVPDQVMRSVELRLVDFRPGSVVPVLEQELNLDLGDEYNLLAAAQQLIDTAFAAIVEGRPNDYKTLGLSPRRLRSFGKRLSGPERVELKSGNDLPVSYSQAMRRTALGTKNVLSESPAATPLTELTLVGLLRGLESDASGGTFKLRTYQGREVIGKFDDIDLFNDLKAALEILDGSSFVRLRVTAHLSDPMRTIDSVSQVEQFDVDPSPWRERLRALLAADHDWDEMDDVEPPRIDDLQLIDKALRLLPERTGLAALIGVLPNGHAFVEWIGTDFFARLDLDDDLSFSGYRKLLSQPSGETVALIDLGAVVAWAQRAVPADD